MTLVGKRGTLVARNRVEWLDVPQGYALFTGTWRVVRGTGDYAGLAGGGRVAGVTLPNGEARWRREGFLGLAENVVVYWRGVEATTRTEEET